nr:hypothetical protein [Candidatus Sigynarchaeota archaeon]
MKFVPYPASLPDDVTWQAVEATQRKFADDSNLSKDFNTLKLVFGLDGYVDSLYSLVSKRDSVDAFSIMASMTELARKLDDVAGSSCNVERVLKKHIGGGFGPNIARATGSLGASVDLIGCLGAPDEIFVSSLPKNVQCHSLGNPGATCALEFEDGKVMITDFGPVNGVTWDLIKARVGLDAITEMFEQSNAIGQGHWALVPHMNEVWTAWLHDVFPSISNKKRIFFVDPADMGKRPKAHVKEMVGLLEKIGNINGLKPILSLNDKEVLQIIDCFPEIGSVLNFDDYYTIGTKMMERFNIDAIIIHSPHFATWSSKQRSWHVKEGFTSKPRFTTAAGDHFNGAALVAIASGIFAPEEALVVANANTASFVRTGISPDINALSRFITNYKRYVDEDLDTIV